MGRGSSKISSGGGGGIVSSVEQKYNISIDISQAGNYQNEAKENVKHLGDLMNEYNSTVISYGIASSSGLNAEAGSAYMLNGKTAIIVEKKALRHNKATDDLGLGENQHLGTTYHEFAHSLSQSREKVDKDFWKEIRALKRDYQNQLNTPEWSKSKISRYANTDIDEFFAEGFTQAKLSKNPSKYSKKVLEITDKYFKKK